MTPRHIAVLLSMAAGSLLAATDPVSAQVVTVRAEALIDGRSQLRLSGNSAQWLHLDHAAPGRHEGVDEPTRVGGATWFPRWPDIPDRENRDCQCLSSADPVLAIPLPLVDAFVRVRSISTRWPATVIELPSALNEYTTVVEFDDRGFTGSAWWIVEIEVKPRRSLFASFAYEALDLNLYGQPGANDRLSAVTRFLPPEGATIDPLAQAVAFDFGTIRVTIPPGSFRWRGDLAVFSGPVDGVAGVDAVFRPPHGDLFYTLAMRATGVDIATVRDAEYVGLRIGETEGRVRARLSGRLRAGSGTTTAP